MRISNVAGPYVRKACWPAWYSRPLAWRGREKPLNVRPNDRVRSCRKLRATPCLYGRGGGSDEKGKGGWRKRAELGIEEEETRNAAPGVASAWRGWYSKPRLLDVEVDIVKTSLMVNRLGDEAGHAVKCFWQRNRRGDGDGATFLKRQ